MGNSSDEHHESGKRTIQTRVRVGVAENNETNVGDNQETEYREAGEAKQVTGYRCVRTISREIFSFLEFLCRQRNERLHETENYNKRE